MDPRKTTIEGEAYELHYLDPEKSIRVLNRLIKIGGPSIAKMFSNASEGTFTDLKSVSLVSVLDMEIEKAIGPIVEALAFHLDEDVVWTIIKDLLSSVRMGTGMPLQMESQFLGKTRAMLMVVKEAIVFNYQDFFSGSKG